MSRYSLTDRARARRFTPRLQQLAATGLLLSALSANAGSQGADLVNILTELRNAPERAADSGAITRATSALKYASELDLKRASQAINEALQADARNPNLHFFNGFIYHLQARQGDTEKTGLAIEGYRQAVRIEPENWVAHEFLGLAQMEQKQYAKAQAAFAEVLLLRQDDPVVLARMLAASYLAGDARTACAMADQLDAGPLAQAESFLRTAVSVYAACGEFDKAEQHRQAFAAISKRPAEAQQAARRLAQWQSFFRARGQLAEGAEVASLVKTQYGGMPVGQPGAGSGFSAVAEAAPHAAAAAAASRAGSPKMVLVDVVMLRTEDSISTTKGVNLLGALTLQFGSATAAAWSRVSTGRIGEDSSAVLTKTITVPALAYSLNLANATSNLNEVLARPTLAAVEGMKSEFFSGTSLNAAVVANAVSGGSAVSLERRYGVRLTVLPQLLPNGMIKLAIDASRTFLKAPSPNIGFTYKLEISEIQANANVVMRMGDTLVLGGLSEKESTSNRDGVPVLQDVPGLQYLFAQQTRTDYQKSVLILITPRPAAYTWLAEEAAAANSPGGGPDAASEDSKSTSVLRARYGDWFKPYPNLASVFHHLNYADLYREFRTGDVTLEQWDRMDSTRERLRQALSFLYY